ncbi:MAG TPA: DUF1365 family protein [Marmoricola sp.]|nr:DUF1365 family protein [Marmoricola sp.]
MSAPTARRIAVVGSGVAGLTAAYVASRPGPDQARVTVFEADDRLGGHADTHVVAGADGHAVAIDTGFIVHNRRTYPTLLRLFDELDVPTQASDMSMSVRSDADRLEWAGALGPRGVFPSWRNAVRPSYLRMLGEIPRFHRRARALLESAEPDPRTLAEFLADGGFSPFFCRHFMTPLVAAVWSCDPARALDYPAQYLFAFLSHHGMLGVFGSPRWRTVTGGSHVYVDRVAAAVAEQGGEIRTGTKVTSVLETTDGVEITDGNGEGSTYDAVVLATHPGQALALLARPSEAQRAVLGAMPYSANLAQLHTDTSVLPRNRRAWASWNHYERPEGDGQGGVVVTYDLTRLMALPSPGGTRYLVTLGGTDLVDQSQVIATMDYEHPMYTPASVAAQQRADELDTDRMVFAGAWRGWGFHEDGARSGLQAVERLGLTWPTPARPRAQEQPLTGIYRTTISHTRRRPLRKHFTQRSTWWLVDLDALPDHGRVASLVTGRFEARDHLGDPDRPIRANVATFLERHGLRLDDGSARGTVLMAAQPRALGFCFNPITVFWCRDPQGAPLATVVEVHNTYGDRHAYLVHPDEHGRASVDKAMYVSPFHGTDGRYDLVVPEPAAGRLSVAVRLTTDDGSVFDASVLGRRSSTISPLRAAPAAMVGAVLIRVHGIALWLRRLPVRPRPPRHRQEGVQ